MSTRKRGREGGEDKNIQLMIKFNVHFFFSSYSYSLTRRKGITYGINTKKKKKSVNDYRKINANEYIIWTSSGSNNNKSITMPTAMCLEIGDKRRNAYIYIFFFFFSWALELVLAVGARCNIHSFLFFFLLKKARMWVISFLSPLDSRMHTHTHTYYDYYPHHRCVLTCCFCVCKI